MTLQGVTYQGPTLEDPSRLSTLPNDLIEVLWQINGFVAYAGGLHVRGLVDEPAWHSLDNYVSGPMALHKLFQQIADTDFPFAQDYLGNQFLLRRGRVWKLRADTGEATDLALDLAAFFGAVREDAIAFLELQLLAEFHQLHGPLEPGSLVHTMPPLCVKREDNKIAMKPVPIDNALSFLANFSKQVAAAPDGERVTLRLFTPEDEGRVQ